jgi:hypothetical protein
MMRQTLLILAILAGFGTVNVWCQVEPSASGGSGETSDDSLMSLPPQVSGAFYPSTVGSQERSNTLSAGIITSAAYVDNVLPGETSQPISGETYSTTANIRLAMKTGRSSGGLTYSPGFIFFEPTTELNSFTQNVAADFQYRVSPRLTLSAQDVFQQNSTEFSQPYTFAGATISGGEESTAPLILLPYVGQVMDFTNVHLGYQFSRLSMIGGSGSFSTFDFSNLTQYSGLYDSIAGGGSVFYSRRLGRRQYMGLSYRYSISESSPISSTTESQYGSAFYSILLAHGLSVSVIGGPEYSTTTVPGSVASHTWAPSGSISAGWQKSRANLAATYSRSVMTGWGLLGAYTTDNGSLALQWQFTRRLFGGVNGNYANTKNATPQITSFVETGHSLFGRASLQYALSQHLNLVGEYSRLHQAYRITEILNNPDVDRVAVSLQYSLTRPLGQ